MLATTPSKTKISSKAVAGIIIGVVAVAAIGGAIFYFRGFVPAPETEEISVPVNLSKIETSASDSYMINGAANGGGTGLHLSTSEFISKADTIALSETNNPFSNTKSFIAPDVCAVLSSEFSAQGENMKLVFFKDDTETTEMTINYDDPTQNEGLEIKIKFENKYYGLEEYFQEHKGLANKLRYEYDPRYMLFMPESKMILPLAPNADKDENLLAGAPDALRARLCEGIAPALVNIKIPQKGFHKFTTQSNNKVGTYSTDFLKGLVKSQSLLDVENQQKVSGKIISQIKLDVKSSAPAKTGGNVLIYLSPDGGNTWIAPTDGEADIIETLNGGNNLQETKKSFTYQLDQIISDLRMIAVTANTTPSSGANEKANPMLWTNALNSTKNTTQIWKKPIGESPVEIKTLFMLPNQAMHPKVNINSKKDYNLSKLNLFSKYSAQLTPNNDELTSSSNATYFTQVLTKIKPTGPTQENVTSFDEETDVAPVMTAMVLPFSSPVITSADLTLITSGTGKTITGGTPTPTPTETPITKVENGLGIEYVLQHRGQSRVIVKFRMFSANAGGKEITKLDSVDPRKIGVKYGESKDALNLGSNVYKNPKDSKYPYAIVLQGLKGGQKTDKNSDGYINGRFPHYFRVGYQGKSTTGDFKTLNRLQALCYYYSLLLNRPYCTNAEGLVKWEDKDAEYDGQKVLALEKGGVGFHYNSTATTQGTKFIVANDRKIKEYDNKIEKIDKEKGVKEVVKELYRYLDRIYAPYDEDYKKGKVEIDLEKYYDDAGVDYWTAMTDAKAIKKYYPKKGKKDIMDIFGVKFGVSASDESKEMFVQSLAGTGSENEAKANAEAEFAYQIILKRGADESGKNYAAKLGSYRKIAQYLVVSDEYDKRLREIEKTLGRKEAVTEMYETIYRRPADLQGVEHWTASGLALDALQKKFLTSKEFGGMK